MEIKMEYKSFDFTRSADPIELGKGEWVIEGYASMRNIDNGNDRLVRDAFLETIKERFIDQKAKNGKSKIKVLWQHQPEIIIGQLLEAREDDLGLFIRVKLIQHPRFGHAERCYVLAQLGEIDSFSIGYKVLKDKKVYENGREVRELIKVKWYEVSFVTFPMNELAEFTAVKESDEMDEKILEAINGLTEQVSLALKQLATPAVQEEVPVQVAEEVKAIEEPTAKADDLVVEVKFNVKELEDVFVKFREDILTEVKSLFNDVETKSMMKCKDCGSSMECKKCSKTDPVMESIGLEECANEKNDEEVLKEYEEATPFNLPEVVEASEEVKEEISNPENKEEDFLDFLLTKEFKF